MRQRNAQTWEIFLPSMMSGPEGKRQYLQFAPRLSSGQTVPAAWLCDPHPGYIDLLVNDLRPTRRVHRTPRRDHVSISERATTVKAAITTASATS
jgi:hypothetical protein